MNQKTLCLHISPDIRSKLKSENIWKIHSPQFAFCVLWVAYHTLMNANLTFATQHLPENQNKTLKPLKLLWKISNAMETESTIDENQSECHKKGRVRRKHILQAILNQMHFYFSDSNLGKDRFLAEKLKESEYIDLSVFLSFNKVRKLTSSVEEIAKALRKSEVLEVHENGTQVKRRSPPKIKPNEDECTLYVQTLQPDTSHEWLINVFSEFGKVDYVSIPKYTHNKLCKGFAFVEYENVEQVRAALEYFESVGLRISSQIDVEELCSNQTSEVEQQGRQGEVTTKEDDQVKNQEHGDEDKQIVESESGDKKRKLSDEEDSDISKKQKVDDKEVDVEMMETKKKKKKSSKRKAQIKEFGLQILPKLEWKKLRNRYWEMQRKKMKQLKQHLTKRRMQQNYKHEEVQQPVLNAMKNEGEVSDPQPGLIVKLKLSEPFTDPKKIKNELKTLTNTIQYVDVKTTLSSDEVYLRFGTSEEAKEFCGSNTKGEGIVLENEEEKQYWEQIKLSRDARLNKEVKKQRGRDKLLKRAERELGKHIRFDDN